MDPFGRFILAALAIFVLWSVVRAMRRGVIYSRGVEFNVDEHPFLYALGLMVHLLITAFLLWCAAGYEPSAFCGLIFNASRA